MKLVTDTRVTHVQLVLNTRVATRIVKLVIDKRVTYFKAVTIGLAMDAN